MAYWRKFFFCAMAALLGTLSGCNGQKYDAAVIMLDSSYRPVLLAGEGDGIDAPDGLRWHAGRLFIADEGGSAIRVYADGRFAQLADASSGISSPEDLVVDARGRIFFSDDTSGGLWRIDELGEIERVDRQVRLGPTEGIALAANGMVLIGEPGSGTIWRFENNGVFSRFSPSTARTPKPESLAYDQTGNLYVADNQANRLFRMTPDGLREDLLFDDEDFSPETIAFAGEALFITDSHNGKLYRYVRGKGLQAIAVFAGDLANISGIAADNAGNLYVSVQADLDRGRGYIVKLVRLESGRF